MPLHLVTLPMMAHTSLGLLDGMLKYGQTNWRATSVSASVYLSAALRHVQACLEGENEDPSSGLHPVACAVASLSIYLDAMEIGTLVDDRRFPARATSRP
jgi:hypothetical protein